jgi:hypothetical protein
MNAVVPAKSLLQIAPQAAGQLLLTSPEGGALIFDAASQADLVLTIRGTGGTGGGASSFADLGGSPYDNAALLAALDLKADLTALDAKQDKPAAPTVPVLRVVMAATYPDLEADLANLFSGDVLSLAFSPNLAPGGLALAAPITTYSIVATTMEAVLQFFSEAITALPAGQTTYAALSHQRLPAAATAYSVPVPIVLTSLLAAPVLTYQVAAGKVLPLFALVSPQVGDVLYFKIGPAAGWPVGSTTYASPPLTLANLQGVEVDFGMPVQAAGAVLKAVGWHTRTGVANSPDSNVLDITMPAAVVLTYGTQGLVGAGYRINPIVIPSTSIGAAPAGGTKRYMFVTVSGYQQADIAGTSITNPVYLTAVVTPDVGPPVNIALTQRKGGDNYAHWLHSGFAEIPTGATATVSATANGTDLPVRIEMNFQTFTAPSTAVVTMDGAPTVIDTVNGVASAPTVTLATGGLALLTDYEAFPQAAGTYDVTFTGATRQGAYASDYPADIQFASSAIFVAQSSASGTMTATNASVPARGVTRHFLQVTKFKGV